MPFLLLLSIIAVGLPAPAVAQDDVPTQAFDAVLLARDALTEWFARTLPLPSASAGVTYSFDPATGNFRRDPSTFGQIYLERADPIGAGHFNLSFAYQYTELDALEGMDADDLTDDLPIPFEGLSAAMEIPNFHVAAAVHSFLLSTSYGFTDDFDVSFALPIMVSDIETGIAVAAVALTEEGELVGLEEVVDDREHPAGIGDILLRAKYRVLELDNIHAATGLLLRIPTGNKDDLQGTGFVEVAPSLLASSRIFEAAEWARLQGHLNATVGFNAENVDSSDARWGIGLDWSLTESITTAVAFLGRHPFARIGGTDAFLLPRCNSDLITCAIDPSVRETTPPAPLFGLTGDRTDYYTFSIGGRVGLWRDTVFGLLNFAFPLNDAFIRTKPIPMIGVEATL